LLLAACAAAPPPVRPPPEPTKVPAANPAANAGDAADAADAADAGDASPDWSALMLMPFGTLLKMSPVALHEVLLFRDEAHPAAPTEALECYAPNGAAPTFFGEKPDEYLLCFADDRLERINASVRIAAPDAPARFVHACRLWLQEALPQALDGVCDGRRGGISFHAKLSPMTDAAGATVSLTLTAAPAP
jgi:hypothetical protein